MKRPKVILLVENDMEHQALFMEAIGEIENASLIAITNNGRQALNRLNNHLTLPDIIFMDIDMPVMNGLECLAEIIKTPELRHIPVVILSTDTCQEDFLYKLGAKALIKKTGDYKMLRTQLELLINSGFIAESHATGQTFQTRLLAS
ncbi:MAG TPA: response regulator [Parafilimonas sp.]|nr:response regulator [Parafilimonas sp.]